MLANCAHDAASLGPTLVLIYLRYADYTSITRKNRPMYKREYLIIITYGLPIALTLALLQRSLLPFNPDNPSTDVIQSSC